jgi:hypothetical protein
MNLQITKTVKGYFDASTYQIRILTGALFAAIVADGVITRYLVHNGLAQEGNPFMQYWVDIDKILTLKICGGLIAALYLWSIYRRHPRLSIVFTSILLAGYIFIVGWNLHILLYA